MKNISNAPNLTNEMIKLSWILQSYIQTQSPKHLQKRQTIVQNTHYKDFHKQLIVYINNHI